MLLFIIYIILVTLILYLLCVNYKLKLDLIKFTNNLLKNNKNIDGSINKNNIQLIQNNRHNYLFKNLPISYEIPERLAVYDNINEKDIVLEIGGNIGGVSSVIATILDNPKNLVVIEPCKSAVEELKKVKNIIQKNFNIFNGVLTSDKKKINCNQPIDKGYSECKEANVNEEVNILNKTFYEIQEMYGLIFDTLIIDCEGCYENIFIDSVESGWLNQINKISIEWDGKFMEDFLLNKGFKLIDYKEHSSMSNGVRTYIKNN